MNRKILLSLIAFLQIALLFSQENGKDSIQLNESKGYLELRNTLFKANRPPAGFQQRVINPDGSAGGINVKGNITFIANNVLNRDSNNRDPEDPYDGNDSNGSINMQYIDIDNDGTTDSSSSDVLNLPNCSRVVHAGLYWAGVYPADRWNNLNGGRSDDPHEMKFKLPGGAYQDIVATTADREIIFDDNFTYICYKDITGMIQGLGDDPNGTYFGANVRAIRGVDSNGGLGGSGGWIMVVIYENETETSKNISVFDGFAEVSSGNNQDISYSGFTTVPVGPNINDPAPVRASLLAATLEGDRNLRGDSFQIQEAVDPNGDGIYEYIDQYTPNVNPRQWVNGNWWNPGYWRYNFFNGSISRYDQYVTTRVPDSENTLGLDVDLYELNNPNNSVIGNEQTTANVRFTTNQDVYWPFLNALTVEIIAPEIELIKGIVDASGNDIQGTDVTLGSELWYDISFQNVGTDDATNTIITDRLPKNVDLLTTTAGNGSIGPDGITYFDIDLPDGVTIAGYDPPSASNDFRAEVRLSVEDSMVLEGGAVHSIRMHVQVVSDCNDLRDVCSNVIENQAFAKCDGVKGGVVVNNPSFSGIDACDFGIVGSSNFLVDVDDCGYEREEVLCGTQITLIAGADFASYEWVNAANPSVVLGTNQTLVVTQVGQYIVRKVAPTSSGCLNTQEIINVIPFGSGGNPIVNSLNVSGDSYITRTCSNNNVDVVEIYLCGDSDLVSLATGITAPTTVKWQQLRASCSPDPDPDCPNLAPTCWEDVATSADSPTRNFSDPGQYRVVITEEGGCFGSYYFNVFKANITPTITTEDIICSNPGNITISGVPTIYEYAIVTSGSPAPADSAYQSLVSPETTFVFSVTTAGNYDVYIKSDDTSCVYFYPNYQVNEVDIDVNIETDPIQCYDSTGEIRIQINSDIPAPYSYTITSGGSTVGTYGPTSDKSYPFTVSNGGTYTVNVTSAECNYSEDVTFTRPPELTLTAVNTKDISCIGGSSDGIITLTAGGGTPSYNFAIWSYVPASTASATAISYTNVSDISSGDFFTDPTVLVPNGSEGTYEFIVIDTNNCSTISSSVEIILEPELQFTQASTDITCSGNTDGTITVAIDGDAIGYTPEYSIDGGATYSFSGSFTGLAAGSYTIDVRATKGAYSCPYTVGPITINNVTTVSSTASLTQDYTCGTLGEITFTAATGGTPGTSG
ncbi:putative repeat protein (TIGR01451 family), partial [Tenacibaculum adriaticum]